MVEKKEGWGEREVCKRKVTFAVCFLWLISSPFLAREYFVLPEELLAVDMGHMSLLMYLSNLAPVFWSFQWKLRR